MKRLSSLFTIIISLVLITLPVSAAYSAEQAEAASITEVLEFTVNINTASAEEMATLLKGIGEKKAQAIVEFREQQGPFAKIDDIVKVKGIGPGFLAKNQSHLSVE